MVWLRKGFQRRENLEEAAKSGWVTLEAEAGGHLEAAEGSTEARGGNAFRAVTGHRGRDHIMNHNQDCIS